MEVPCPPKGMRDTRVFGLVIRSVNAYNPSVSVLHILHLVADELTYPARDIKCVRACKLAPDAS